MLPTYLPTYLPNFSPDSRLQPLHYLFTQLLLTKVMDRALFVKNLRCVVLPLRLQPYNSY